MKKYRASLLWNELNQLEIELKNYNVQAVVSKLKELVPEWKKLYEKIIFTILLTKKYEKKNKPRVTIIFGTRPEAIRNYLVIKVFKECNFN